MNASYEWLRAFVPFNLSPTELRDMLTSRSEIEPSSSPRTKHADTVLSEVHYGCIFRLTDHVVPVDHLGEGWAGHL